MTATSADRSSSASGPDRGARGATIAARSTRPSARPTRSSPSTSSASSSRRAARPPSSDGAVILELVRLVRRRRRGDLARRDGPARRWRSLAATGAFDRPLPDRLAGVADGRADWPRPAGPPARRPRRGAAGDRSRASACRRAARSMPDGLRVAQLARHELAVAFGGARLREALERERHELGAGRRRRDRRDRPGRRGRAAIVRLNPAGERTLGVDARDGDRPDLRRGPRLRGRRRPRARSDCPLAEVIATGEPIGYRETAIRGAARRRRSRSPAATRAPRPSPAEPSGRRRSSATSPPFGRSSSCARASSRRSATSSGRRSPWSAATPRRSSISTSTRTSSATTSSGSTRSRRGSDRLVDQILDVTHLDADPLILERAPVAFARARRAAPRRPRAVGRRRAARRRPAAPTCRRSRSTPAGSGGCSRTSSATP